MDEQTTLREKVTELIENSIRKRLTGHGDIDPRLSNEVLIRSWLKAIRIIAENNMELEPAAQALFALQHTRSEFAYLEDTRAYIQLTFNRFYEEIDAYSQYVELDGKKSEEVILDRVMALLDDVQDGDFSLF